VTEVPDYLLARSRERRAAMGGGGAGASGDDAGTGSAPVVPAEAAAAPAPAVPAPVAPAEPAAPEPVPPFVEAALNRKRMPVWVVPVLLLLPVWAIYYVGMLERPPASATGLLGEGQVIFAADCAACHGAGGGGAVGQKLNDGEVLLTFPDLGSHISWVINGSPVVNGTPYGDPARPGGQRMSGGGMPGWAETLTPEELVAAVYYERVTHGGLDAETAASDLELLEAYVDSGVTFEGGETPRDISTALSDLVVETDDAAEEASG
jgi:mono/diheme cytochrome c family protein